MKFSLPFHVGAKPETPELGPRPFSGEWVALAPEERAAPRETRVFVLPNWIPSEQVMTGLLVILLVISSLALGGPGISPSDAKGPQGDAIAAAALTPEPTVPAAAPTSRPSDQPTPLPTPTATPKGAAPTLVAGINVTTESTQPPQSEPGALLPKYRIVAYYGHPNAVTMGILGEFTKDQLLTKLTAEKQAYEAADPSRPVKMAFEVIASVAQTDPAENGSYLRHTDAKTILEYAYFARDHDMILILDLQIGHSTVKAEIETVRDYLKLPYVHLALDPEFALSGDQVPGDAIGSIDATDVAYAQSQLQAIATQNNLPPKLLIVHRFTENMITNSENIKAVAGVQTVIDFDGFGAPDTKIGLYEHVIGLGGAQFAGIKLFYKTDIPRLKPAQVLALKPAPDFVVFH